MSDETEEYVESVSIPTLVWIGEPGSGRREMASAFVKARFSTMALDGTIAEKPEWNTVLPDGDGAESLQKGLRKDHYARICLFDAPKGEEADALMRGAYDKPLSKALRGAHVLVWFVSCPRLPDPGMLGLLRTMRAICPDVPLLISMTGRATQRKRPETGSPGSVRNSRPTAQKMSSPAPRPKAIRQPGISPRSPTPS